jgi:hypothetical protein
MPVIEEEKIARKESIRSFLPRGIIHKPKPIDDDPKEQQIA